MNKSECIGELAEALSKAQAEIKPAEMNAKNPFLKNNYADLGSVISAARPALSKYGLSFTQLVGGDVNNVTLETVLMHTSGEWIGTIVNLPVGEEKGRSLAQNMGAIVTYLRRYSLAAILGVYSDEDTDGSNAGKQERTTDPRAPINAPKPTDLPPAQKATGGGVPDALVKAGVCQNTAHAGKLIDMYMPAEIQGNIEKAVAWGKLYRGWRDLGVDVEPAAQNATAGAVPES
jgi:hypothetical protein